MGTCGISTTFKPTCKLTLNSVHSLNFLFPFFIFIFLLGRWKIHNDLFDINFCRYSFSVIREIFETSNMI